MAATGSGAGTARRPVHLSVDERIARGRAARAESSRRKHGQWEPAAGRRDPVDVLEDEAATRVPELVPIRYGRMLTSSFAFYRGAAALMAADLAPASTCGIRVQLCGDAHLSNFGFFASPERSLVFSVNDFDETLPGPWEWDVKRLAASFVIAARARGNTEVVRRRLVMTTVGAYRTAMREFAAMRDLEVWYARLDAGEIRDRWGAAVGTRGDKTFSKAEAKAQSKDSTRALLRLTERVDGTLRFRDDPPLLVPIENLADREREVMLGALDSMIAAYRRTLQRDRRRLLDRYRFVDLARKVVGVGSVGTRAWVALFLGRDDQDPLVLQFKEAEASVLEPYAGKSRYANQGQRVVEGQRLMQSSSDIFLGWHRVAEGLDRRSRDFYVRQLWDWKASAEVEIMAPRTLLAYGEMCGWTLARAHARTGDRIAIAAYLGSGDVFDQAMASFGELYADQNEHDFAALEAAVATGRVTATRGL